MPAEQRTTTEQIGLMFLPATFARLDWTKPFTDTSVKIVGGFCREALKFTSRRLQEQTDYFKELAECDNPAKFLSCNGEFLRKSLVNSVEDSQRAFAAIQGSLAGSKSS
ncbi:Phasin protein [Enhydrobacter aerosaccus]|uniref:Phasin protein n=1 Tax=Enhydrobacter aerosaccus TaxID=225324 RepID=A0A1T4JLR6_9HYPH|nr:phasin family protein [Enhydrobacter aerosaccus]SJZ31091.1 Phasin protein [Enhydrobacter aerosaccus]